MSSWTSTDDVSDSSDEPDQEESEESPEEESSVEAPQPDPESVDEMEDTSPSIEQESPENQSSLDTEQTDGPPVPETSMSVEEAADRERRWKFLVWGPPGLFKSHFCYTAPEPIAYLDLEGKADDIAWKFDEKEIEIWQPEGFREAQDALQEAIDWLDWWREEEGEVGTIVVDSISLVWEWAKTAYKSEAYPMTDNEEVTLSSNMGSSSDSDWAHIKGMHNGEFREWITESPYHFVWTAMATEDYAAQIEDGESSGGTPMKAEGEKNNPHKADSIIRAKKNDSGTKVGDLQKSNFTNHLFVRMDEPTFPKATDAIERIEQAETQDGDVDVGDLADEYGLSVVNAAPDNV